MSAELLLPTARATDADGNVYVGAKWHFYATGTTTPQNVFVDADLSTSLGATVTADSGGKFVPIYMDPALVYRGICENASGSTTLHDIDPINSGFGIDLANKVDTDFGNTAQYTHVPIGNSFNPTKAYVGVNGHRVAGDGRIFTASFAIDTFDLSEGGVGTDDTVGIYAAASGNARPSTDDTGEIKADIWGGNFLIHLGELSGTYNARGLEIDVDNFRGNSADTEATLLAGNLVVGLHILGSSYSYCSTAGVVIDNPPPGAGNDLFQSGFVVGPYDPCAQSSFADFGNAPICLEDAGDHTFGIKQTGTIGTNQFHGIQHFHPNVTNSNLLVRNPQIGSDGIAISSVNDANNAFKAMEFEATTFAFSGAFQMNLDGTLKNISYGANDSGGAGYKVLRVAN